MKTRIASSHVRQQSNRKKRQHRQTELTTGSSVVETRKIRVWKNLLMMFISWRHVPRLMISSYFLCWLSARHYPRTSFFAFLPVSVFSALEVSTSLEDKYISPHVWSIMSCLLVSHTSEQMWMFKCITTLFALEMYSKKCTRRRRNTEWGYL